VVGEIPQSLPPFTVPLFDPGCGSSWPCRAAAVGHRLRRSVSVAQTLAAKRRQRIDPDQELIGLGAGQRRGGVHRRLSRDRRLRPLGGQLRCRGRDPAAGAFTAVGIAVAALFLTPLLASCPSPRWPPRSSSPC
jgi:sulfate permease, SulP family